MRIEAVELRHISMKLKSPFRTSFGVEHRRECLIVCMLSQGLRGWGECVAGRRPGYSYETVGTAWHVLSEFFIPAILRAPVETAGEIRERLINFKGHNMAKACLEMALWDLEGVMRGESLSHLLGGVRGRVAVGVSVGIQKDVARLMEVVGSYRKRGYRRIKIKIEPGRDLAEIRALRREFPHTALQVDGNAAYEMDDCCVFEAMDDLGLLMIEQPFAQDDLIAHAKLQARLETAVCLDESITSLPLARQAIDLDAARVINIKQARVGGLANAVQIHHLSRERNVPVWCGGMLETGIGRAANLALASLPGFDLPGDISASDRYYAQDIAEPRFTLNPDSSIEVPTGPGLGVQVSRRILDKVTRRKEIFRA